MSVVMPRTFGRLAQLDLLRGIFILGILLANIVAFARPEAITRNFGMAPPFDPRLAPIENWLNLLVSGKFRSMLCILFGIGMWLELEKRRQTQSDPSRTYMRRMGFLILIGLIHGYFIWWGDILAVYGFTGFIVATFAHAKANVLRNVMIAGLVVGILMGVFIGGASMMGSSTMTDLGPLNNVLSPEVITQAHQSGSWGVQFLYRLGMFTMMILSLAFIAPVFGALFCYGILLARSGAIQNPEVHRDSLLKTGWISLGVGLPLHLPMFFSTNPSHRAGLALMTEMIAAPITAIGLVSLLVYFAPKVCSSKWAKPLVQTGRMSLSVYILQSVLCTTLFYSFGFKLYGKLQLDQLMLFVLGVWVVCVVFANVWLSRFTIGPVEWVWRSMTEKRKLPWKATPAPPVVFESASG